MTETPTGPCPVLSVPLSQVRDHPSGPLIARVTEAEDVQRAPGLPLERVVWIETPLVLAEAPWPDGAGLDVIVREPAREAAGLYVLDRVARRRAVRVTVEGKPGLGRAARIAMALQLPVRLLALQPSLDVVAEIEDVLDCYLHDSKANAPVELLQSALAWQLFGRAPTAWAALELDPAWYARLADDDRASPLPASASPKPGFVPRWRAALAEGGAECRQCRFEAWCQGFFKWPDPAYACAGVLRLLGRIEASASDLSRDLAEARELRP